VNKREAEVIAGMANIARPDWPIPSLMTQLAKYATRPARDVAVAMVWLAMDPDTDSPGRISQHGPWWEAAIPRSQPIAARQPKIHDTANQCPHHPGEWRGSCRSCAADKLAGETPA
jgi:hypothetical protein